MILKDFWFFKKKKNQPKPKVQWESLKERKQIITKGGSAYSTDHTSIKSQNKNQGTFG